MCIVKGFGGFFFGFVVRKVFTKFGKEGFDPLCKHIGTYMALLVFKQKHCIVIKRMLNSSSCWLDCLFLLLLLALASLGWLWLALAALAAWFEKI